jgi:CheY-like chemotaxis protein
MPDTASTIVVLEENAAAQELIDQALRQSGHRVLITNNPMEILALARRVRIDLLVGDISLLDATEPKLAERLRSITRTTAVAAPFSLQEFEQAVAAALGRERADA